MNDEPTLATVLAAVHSVGERVDTLAEATGRNFARVEDRITRVEDRITRVEDRITRVEDRITRVETGVIEIRADLTALRAETRNT